MNIIEKYEIKVRKSTLLLIAGLLWSFAGFRVFTLGQVDVQSSHGNWLITLVFATIIFLIFFKNIFNKMLKKHIKRIINSKLDKHCIFSFFDFKSYFIMGFMIFFGITIRNLKIFNPAYIGTFYIGLGSALFVACIFFLVNSFKVEALKIKYRK